MSTLDDLGRRLGRWLNESPAHAALFYFTDGLVCGMALWAALHPK